MLCVSPSWLSLGCSSSLNHLAGGWFVVVPGFVSFRILYQVTSDIHAIQTVAVQVIVLTVSVGSLARSLLGPLPFWASFMFTEMLKISTAFAIGLFNVSAFLQMAIITSIRWRNNSLFVVKYLENHDYFARRT